MAVSNKIIGFEDLERQSILKFGKNMVMLNFS